MAARIGGELIANRAPCRQRSAPGAGPAKADPCGQSDRRKFRLREACRCAQARRVCRSDRRHAVLLRPGGGDRDASHGVLRRGNDEVSLRDRGSHFDYPQFASTLRDRVRERAASLAAQAGITIEHIAKSHIRKEAVVAKVLKRRGEHPGLVHVISAMEACGAYQPWHDKQMHKTFVRPDSGKCLHYYFYFIDDELGLVYLRVPTWAPFRLQFYGNGHSWLARQLTAEGIGFTAADNAFIRIDDWQRAQDLADRLSPDRLHLVLDRGACPRAGQRPDPWAAQCCPVLDVFRQSYHWSLMQVE